LAAYTSTAFLTTTLAAREGDKVSELPVPEPPARSIFAIALKGDPPAQRLMLHELRAAEERNPIRQQEPTTPTTYGSILVFSPKMLEFVRCSVSSALEP
jgi:hypothetical protein